MREPRFIELDEAVSRIKQACQKPSRDSSPFFFMVGAGISCPSVPLAMDIVSECKEVAKSYGRSVETPATTGVDLYSHWFQTAYAEPYQRQEYLRALIEGKPITHANFRLAHLLLQHTISNIVVTTNFDDFLSKALGLFGKSHIVCDHPQTAGRINHTQPMLQIVHLHGSYWFYDCCNLRGELEDRAQQSEQTTLTMASLLDMILWDRSPLIIGYSGWEGDVFTEALKRRLARPLRSNAYWFCYKRSDVDSIPDWLKYHANISFVVPNKKPISKPDPGPAATGTDARLKPGQPLVEDVKSTASSAEKLGEPVLPADTVLDKLIRAFELMAPELTKDPLGFFAKQLDNSLPKDPASDTDYDIYAIKRVIERVTRAKQRDDNEAVSVAGEPLDSHLEDVRDALRRADYREAIRQGSQIVLSDLSSEDLAELADAMWAAARRVSEHPDDAVRAYDLVISIRDEEARKQVPETPATRTQLARSMLSKGVALHTMGRSEESIAVFEELIRRSKEATESDVQTCVAIALVNKGIAFATLSRIEEEIDAYDEMLQRFGEAANPTLREQIARALLNRGVALESLRRSKEAIASYDELLKRFGEVTEPALQEQVAKALRNRGVALGSLDRREEAIEGYNELLRRFGEASEPALREQVAKALINKGVSLGTLNRLEEEIAVYDELLRRFGDASEPALQEQVAKALLNKAVSLGSRNGTNEEIAVYDELLQRFEKATEPAIREQVGRALLNKGVALGTANRNEEELAVYDELLRRFEKATKPALQEQMAMALVNKGITLGTLNRREEAIAAYDELIRLFGDAPGPVIREQILKAFMNKQGNLDALNRTEEAIATCREVVQRYGQINDPALNQPLAHALNTLGFRLLISGKSRVLSGDKKAAELEWHQAHEHLTSALERSPDEPIILGNQGYIHFLLGDIDKARELLTRAIEIGGETIRTGELNDAAIHRLPQDDKFCALVNSIPFTPQAA
jgi:tetratricopeptide (TPR) repeat protein